MSSYPYGQYPQPQYPGSQLPFPPPDQSQTPPAPPAKQSTPLDPPVVYYNQIWRVPPLVVDTQEAADALDPNEWTTGAPAASGATKAAKPQWPQLYYNVNVVPKIVDSAGEAAALGGDWQPLTLPDVLLKAAEANNQAKAAADAAKAQSQSQSQPQSPYSPSQPYPGQPGY